MNCLITDRLGQIEKTSYLMPIIHSGIALWSMFFSNRCYLAKTNHIGDDIIPFIYTNRLGESNQFYRFLEPTLHVSLSV